MKTISLPNRNKGFTLIELLVAMTITVILLGVLVYMTGISMDTYRNSRDEVRASRQAKEALSTISKDFESMISRRDGNNYEWLYAGQESGNQGPTGNEIPNTSRLIFFTGATDRYNGDIGGTNDEGGDVSAVSYRLVFRDQIGDTEDDRFAVFSLYRHLVDPDEAFDYLAVTDLDSTFDSTNDLASENFLVENIYEFTVTFVIEVTVPSTSGASVTHTVRASMKPGALTEFRIKGSALDYTGTLQVPSGSGLSEDQIKSGRVVGVDIAMTVLTDVGLTLSKRLGSTAWEKERGKHMHHFSKSISVPRS
ncbi:prepilin-type N-terminal cleavage/methylation domain-containing protein [Verrucomicrobiaceae bacterium R5-34]|uniref:Prepilin-type N-terminal cleavage/methylation domain-containing protein n=1 Tax=Oceaniferula flava TaxID=2800421 RepID=A0AAE2SC49_9BACT|nr:prepilin-type N-terminal cleavage/methylation domain-containing protein [Oceaniferula flavus]MBK1831547.1 prepilin-type N-terminal cleavage/methylation domain-containing protein [Verrucomicrobiaceae bacterium R5-34]MBK1854214.1 prepilin-type N-terminal cleavage/methylation domain-containing protein [Oceaniferula flavus]MBM1135520.1 prepilin-type N-terminal cleavage/methylation domain-containing protein [Oceaniferula flavus]